MTRQTATTMMMNPFTGSVAPLEEWQADFNSMTAEERLELWGGPHFEDADLVEVIQDENGDWIEA